MLPLTHNICTWKWRDSSEGASATINRLQWVEVIHGDEGHDELSVGAVRIQLAQGNSRILIKKWVKEQPQHINLSCMALASE